MSTSTKYYVSAHNRTFQTNYPAEFNCPCLQFHANVTVTSLFLVMLVAHVQVSGTRNLYVCHSDLQQLAARFFLCKKLGGMTVQVSCTK